ncbi:MAG: CDP-diacylglycerol--serine O-phosphatidyltransferase [Bacteroidota bacterium]
MPRRSRSPIIRARSGRRERARANARAAVPNFFTLMNLLAGFFSIIQTANGNLEAAAWLVVLAAFFDLFDGLMARLAGVSSDFGLELDSLSDVVSFGVAPSFLLYEFGLDQLGPLWGALLASLPALFGAVRLARFNTLATTEAKSAEFVGLPIPAQAGTVVVFILTFADREWFDVLARPQLSVLITLVGVLSALMISPVRFPALPHPTPANLRRYRGRFLLFTIALLLGVFLQEEGLLISALVYLGIGLGKTLAWVVRMAMQDPSEDGIDGQDLDALGATARRAPTESRHDQHRA